MSSLGKRVMYILVAGILASAIILTLLVESRIKSSFLSLQRKKALQVAEHIAKDIKEHMLVGPDHAAIRHLVISHTTGTDIETALFKSDGSLFAGQTANKPPQELFVNPRDLWRESQGKFLFYKPFMNEKACMSCHVQGKPVLGVLMVSVSNAEQSVFLKNISSNMIFFTVIIAGISGGVLILLLRRIVFSPLSELHRAAETLSSGDYQHRISLSGSDEFGKLASTFNQMAENIRSSHSVLTKEVRQRTEELEAPLQLYKESEARLKEAQQIARLGNWELDVTTGKLWWSDETYRIFGKTAGEPITFSAFLDCVHPEDRDHLARTIDEAIAGNKEGWTFDYRIVCPGPEILYLHEEAKVIFDTSGHMVRRIGTVQDITERKKTEAVLHTLVEEVSGKTDNAFFCSLAENLAKTLTMEIAFVGEIEKDLNHVRTIAMYDHGKFQDNFTYALVGTPCNNVIGKTIRLYPQGVQKLFPEDHMLVEMGVESYIGIPLFASSGRPLGIMVALSSSPMTDLKFLAFVFNMFAIPAASELERMQSDRLLKSQKEYSDTIFDSASSGILVLDVSGRILKVNHAGAAILGSDTEELSEKKITELYPVTEPFLIMDQSVRKEILLPRADGTVIPIGFSNSPLGTSHDLTDGVIVMFRDLSDTKKLQEELRKKDYLATMSQVVSGVAHEVRNPLFGISSIGQILEREIDIPQHRALISAMLKETTRMKNLIDELLLYTRPSRLDIRQLDLGLLFRELEHHLTGKRAEVSVSFDVPLQITISADRDKITQVLLNLLNNAVEAARTSVSVKAMPSEDHAEITIYDDGPGIPPANREKIFEPFFSTKKGGTGLGLPICRKLVEDHDGSLVFHSREGTGTTVILRLKA